MGTTGNTRHVDMQRFDGADETTGIRRRFAEPGQPVNPFESVCIGLFVGDTLSHEVYGANEGPAATRQARRLRSQGIAARLVWVNCGAWARDLWIRDLHRPLGSNPSAFYGVFPGDVTE